MSKASELEEYVKTLEAIDEYERFHKLEKYEPLPKMVDFHAQGVNTKIRAAIAANQIGKTYAGAAEMAIHLTGDYPKWWTGRRWNRPIEAWVAGEGGLIVRDAPQALLCGKPGLEEELGTGLIPRDRIVGKTLSHGVTGAYDTVMVEHRTNGVKDGTSTISFKSYDQGRTKFQAKTLDFFWADEEPPMDIYSELLARISATSGCGIVTFTPAKGRGPLVNMFLDEPSTDRAHWTLTIWDGWKALRWETNPELTEEIKGIIAGYKKYEQAARCYGIPAAGEGAVFEIDPDGLTEPPIPHHQVPHHWRKIWGIDFGIAHPFAAILLLHDPDLDVVHVWAGFRVTGETPLQHVVPMKKVAAAVPVAWPHDGAIRDKGSGDELQLLYKRQGLLMLGEPAMWPSGGNSVEMGISEIEERAVTGRLKISATMTDLLTEWRTYHRVGGVIVKERDDLLSALRYALMMLRKAKPVPLGGTAPERLSGGIAKGLDFDVF